MKTKELSSKDLKKLVKESVKRIHLEKQLKQINEEIEKIDNNGEKEYNSNKYKTYENDIQECVKKLSEASQILETAILKQDSHLKQLPEVEERINEGKKAKELLLGIFKEVKAVKINTERKLYS